MRQLQKFGLCLLVVLAFGAVGAGSALAASEEPTLPITGTVPAPTPPAKLAPHSSPGTSGALPPNSSQCPQYYFCMWENGSYGGQIWSANGSTSEWNFVGWDNDLTSSIWNRRNNASWVDKDWGPSGDYVCIGSGWAYPELNGSERTELRWPQDLSKANDSISSYWLSSSTYGNCSSQYQFYSYE
jgi:hypothetical protein